MRNLIIDYSCSGPEEYKGRSLLSLQQDKNIVNCSYVIDDEDPRTGGDFDMKTPVTSSNIDTDSTNSSHTFQKSVHPEVHIKSSSRRFMTFCRLVSRMADEISE